MSVRSISLNDVSVSSVPTHIIIYQDKMPSLSMENIPTPPCGGANASCGGAKAADTSSIDISEIQQLKARVSELERFIKTLETPKPSPYFHASISAHPVGMEVRRLDDPPVSTVFETLVASVRATPNLGSLKKEETDNIRNISLLYPSPSHQEFESNCEDNEVPDDEVPDDECPEDEGPEDEGPDDEEDAMEFTEFEYKGITYYRDTDNQVYQKDEDGDLDDTAIGVWNEAKQKVLKYKS